MEALASGPVSAPSRRGLRVLLLAGGASAEREISLESGHAVADTLRRRGHFVSIQDPAEIPLAFIPDIDVIFPLLHGAGGEDGTLQRELERSGIPWIGSSAPASALTFSKSATRQTLGSAGLPIASGFTVRLGTDTETMMRAAAPLGLPLVVKPSEQGSSIGITIVQALNDLPTALETAFRWGVEAIVERWIPGREITVPVIDGQLFPAVEILPGRPWYDYDAKYRDERTQYRTNPEGLPPALFSAVRRAVAVCGVSAISRTDLRLESDGRFSILEINTIPGMTSHSLVPMSVAAAGRELGELLEELLWRRLDSASTGAAA
jgi:D-alanine-D-alanine ligase